MGLYVGFYLLAVYNELRLKEAFAGIKESSSRRIAVKENRCQGESLSRRIVVSRNRRQGESLSRRIAVKENRCQGESSSRRIVVKVSKFILLKKELDRIYLIKKEEILLDTLIQLILNLNSDMNISTVDDVDMINIIKYYTVLMQVQILTEMGVSI